MSLLSEIKQAESKDTETKHDPKDMPKDPFEERKLNELWSKFSKTLGRNKQQNLASTLKTAERNLNGSQIGLELYNNVQVREVERIKPELLGYLRRELNNYEIDIICTVREQSGDERPYTPEDKFQHLMKKNPQLLDFKNELDLEVDF